MDFFERQEKARRKTKVLVAYFICAVVLLIALVYVAALLLFAGVNARHHSRYYRGYEPEAQITWWNPEAFLGATIGVLAVVFLGSAYKTSELAAGGSSVAELMGGRQINPNSPETDERRLLNVVEEMSIASGVPMPKVYVLEDERGINAFAAGHSPSDAAVAVSRGCLDLLTRDELQGVIGHEFSHILNGDMRLNLKLIGIIFGLLCLATIGRILLYARGDGRDRNALPLFGIVLVVLGAAGVFFGRLIQAAVSRQREFLADASSVQFTRNPAGLSGALQKIGGYELGSKLESAHAPDLCHMFFGNGLGAPLFEAMATHPPLPDRIRAIDPNWDGKFRPIQPPGDEPDEAVRRHAPPPLPNVLGTILAGGALGTETPGRPPVVQSDSVMPNLGTPTPQHLEYAEKLRESFPESVLAAAREPLDAAALIYAMLLSPDAQMRENQFEELAEKVQPEVLEMTESLYPDVANAAAHAHLPMVNLALGGLRGLTADQYVEFAEAMDWLTKSDGKIELFEFVLQKIILRHLSPQFGYGPKTRVQFYTLKPLVPDCAVVLSALAHVSSEDAGEIQKAFDCGRVALAPAEDANLRLLPAHQCGIDQIDAALNRLAVALPAIKKAVITACVQVVGADGVIIEAEAELLRAISDTLDCPMPPFLTQ
jgi:Zn-dependent protease with chaperone function/uncharacterized tellurite resistance protein B-like protein